jgi:hypothetical protein
MYLFLTFLRNIAKRLSEEDGDSSKYAYPVTSGASSKKYPTYPLMRGPYYVYPKPLATAPEYMQ